MFLLMVLFIWIVYPLAATVVLIVLGCDIRKYKKRIAELEAQTGPVKAEANTKSYLFNTPGSQTAGTQFRAETPKPHFSEVRPVKAGKTGKPEKIEKPVSAYPGTAALIIGVVFVILAGLIFATTAWRILPDVFKAFMVFAFSALLFGASCVADRKLKIERTSRAFYILGSIFLFLTVLTVGYFKLLGPGFVLTGQNRWWVLWWGSVVTECAFIAGFRTYKEKVYTYVYLFGLTVSMTFLMAALRGKGVGVTEGMICYSFLLLLTDRLNWEQKKRNGKGFLPDQAEGIWSGYSIIHFLVFCIFLMPQTLMGFLAQDAGRWLEGFRITPWKLFCLIIAASGMKVAAVRWNGQKALSVLYSLLFALLTMYVVWPLPLSAEYRLMLAVILQGMWFTVNWNGRNPGKVWGEETVSTAALLANTIILMQAALWVHQSLESYTAVTVSLLVLTGVCLQWMSRKPVVKRAMPFLFCALTGSVCGIIGEMFAVDVRSDFALLGCLVVIAVWDIRKNGQFWIEILLLGTIFQIYTQAAEAQPIPFFLFLAVYLFIKSRKMDGTVKGFMEKGSSFYSLAGIYLELYGRLPNRLLEVFAVLGLLALEYAAAVSRSQEQKDSWYWDIAGSIVFLAMMWQYYWNGMEGALWPILCLAVFLLVYSKIYLGRCHGAGLPMTLMILTLPWYLIMRGEFSANQICAAVLAALLVSGVILRFLGPIYRQAEGGGKIEKIDWFRMASGAVIVMMACFGSREWRFIYTLFLIPYFYQYMAVARIRKWAVTAMMAAAVTAWWIQPLFTIPDRIWLEIWLLPLLLFSAGLPAVWGKGKNIRSLQNGIGIFCLASMAFAAMIGGDVWDALILEGVCLIVFFAAYVIRSMMWVKLSGAVIVLAALYMTKGFWLSLSWWVYLLAAGVSLIGFAAWYEAGNREK